MLRKTGLEKTEKLPGGMLGGVGRARPMDLGGMTVVIFTTHLSLFI